MRDLIVTTREHGRSYRLRPGGWLDLDAKTLGSEINQGGVSKKSLGFEKTYRLTYDDLVPYVGTTSGVLIVRYAE